MHHPVPGFGISEEMAARLGCDIDQIKADAETYKAEIRGLFCCSGTPAPSWRTGRQLAADAISPMHLPSSLVRT